MPPHLGQDMARYEWVVPYHHTPPNLPRHAYPGPDPCQEHVDPNQCWPYNNIVIEKVKSALH